MQNISQEYLVLFNAITDALEDLEYLRNTAAMERLRSAQCQAEELYLDAGE